MQVMKNYVYLGIPFCSSGMFNRAANYFASKGKIALGTIWKLMVGKKMSGWDGRLELFDTIVIVLYGYSVQRIR